MFKLAGKFMETLKGIGLSQLEYPVFYHAPYGLRFEIGGEEEVYLDNAANPEYVENALDRALTIYRELPFRLDILLVVIRGNYSAATKSLSNIPLPDFDEGIEDQDGTYTSFYWDCSKLPEGTVKALLREIILADIGGEDLLASSVFWISTEGKYLFHLYDDRGADLVSADAETLSPIYYKFHSWLLDYDREKMDRLFQKWNIVSGQEGIERLQKEYRGFHDAYLVKLEYITGSYVDEKGGMANGLPEEKRLSMTFHSQWAKRPLELCFGGVRKLNIAGWQENYFCEILDCHLQYHTDLIPGRDDPLIVWADTAGFSPQNIREGQLLAEPMSSYVIAESLKWRFL